MNYYANFGFIVNHDWLSDVDNYDSFFHPNICHVCKTINNGNLISCDKCKMVSYCSIEHRRVHHLRHRFICECMRQYLMNADEKSLEKESLEKKSLEKDEWIKSKRTFLRSMEERLGRKLKMDEKQMIMFAKSCFICHRQIDLQTCENCYSESYCIQHKQEFQSQHKLKCEKLMSCLNIDVMYVKFPPIELKFINFADNIESFNDIDEFILKGIATNFTKSYEWITCSTLFKNSFEFTQIWHTTLHFYSDYISGPLTLYHGMKDACLLDFLRKQGPTYVIYIIGADYSDIKYKASWEVFLHVARQELSITELLIVLIGSELELELNANIPLCHVCQSLGQKLSFVTYQYREYEENKLLRPNMVIVFHADFMNNVNPFHAFLRKFGDCPWVLTTTSKQKMQQNMIAIRNCVGEFILHSYYAKNKFTSTRPRRDVETGSVYFRNEFITVYQDLHTSI